MSHASMRMAVMHSGRTDLDDLGMLSTTWITARRYVAGEIGRQPTTTAHALPTEGFSGEHA
jgi:hypothetical protein